MPADHFFHMFDTSLGWMGIAWSEFGVTAVQTPDRDEQTTKRRLQQRAKGRADCAASPPAAIRQAIDLLERYADGEKIDFSPVTIDIEAEQLYLDVWRAARDLGYGETVTYGELASRSGHPGLAREAGQALGANPTPIIVPCHRIVAAGGKLGGFSAPGGARTKERLLALEGVQLGPAPARQSAFAF